jgi:hypothetical protein
VEILGLAEEESREASCWKQENRAKLDEITKGGGVRERGGGDIHTKVDRRKFVLGLFWKGRKKKSNQNHPRKNLQHDEFPTSTSSTTTQNGSVDVDVYPRQPQLLLLKSRFNFLIKTAAGADE